MNRNQVTEQIKTATTAKATPNFSRSQVIKALIYGGMRNRNCGPLQVKKGDYWQPVKPLRPISLRGLTFSGKTRDSRIEVRFSVFEYPQAIDSKGRPMFRRYTRKEHLASIRFGKGNHYRTPVQEGQEVLDSHGVRIPVLDYSKPSPKEDSNGKFVMKTGDYTQRCRISGSNFERADLRDTLWVSFLNKNRITNCDFSRTNWQGASLRNVVFKNCDFRGVDMTVLKQYKNVAFVNCNMRGTRIPADMVIQSPINAHLMDSGRKRSLASQR